MDDDLVGRWENLDLRLQATNNQYTNILTLKTF